MWLSRSSPITWNYGPGSDERGSACISRPTRQNPAFSKIPDKTISKLSGEKELRVPSESLNPGPPNSTEPALSVSWNRQVVPELRLHDVLRLPRDKFLCFNAGHVSMFSRASYFDEKRYPEFKGLYDPDPYYRPRK
jgi:hypothetical protein